MSTQTKDRPILFSGPMVRAILDGRKCQTRRIIKPQPAFVAAPHVPFKTMDADPKGMIDCPYGIPGDRLWVREKWRVGGEFVDSKLSDWNYPADMLGPHVHYATDDIQDHFAGTYRPSIHMPRWASRITLEITAIRVERLQEISETDAIAEGVALLTDPVNARDEFEILWQSINGPESWSANPWVWVVEFRRIES